MPIIEPEFMQLTAQLDLQAFWEEEELCRGFTTAKPRCAVHFSPDDHWLFEFMQVPSTLRYYRDKAYRDDLHRQANNITREYVGRAFFEEHTWEFAPRRIENLFGCEFEYHEGGTPWFVPVTTDPGEFSRILERAAGTDLQTWAFPAEFLAEWESRQAAGEEMPRLGSGSRGPATIMTSVLDVETVFYWFYDHPALMARFADILAAKMVELNTLLRKFSGNTQPGWWITDDNSALFNRRLYAQYCVPVLERVLEAMAPGDAYRYQHSDSAMGHLLDYQYGLGIREVNYGPEVDAASIRQAMPEAMIHGQLPPFLLRNGCPGEIKARIRADFHKAGLTGGLTVTTAGSLAAGTGVGRMRWMMQVVQDDCRLAPSKPSSWEVKMQITSNKNTTALLVIDVQQGLFQQSRPVHQAEQLLSNLETLIEAARRAGALLVFIQHSNLKQLVRDTPAWQLHPRLVPRPGEPTLHKQHGNAFEETHLQAELQAQGVSRVLITGLVTQGCVRATCLGALKLGYQVILVSDAHSTYSKDAPDIIEKWNQALSEKGAVLRETRQIDFNLLPAEPGS